MAAGSDSQASVAGSKAKPSLVTAGPCTPPTTRSLSLATAKEAAQWSDERMMPDERNRPSM